jgi:ElaB/YqjD/DUF883 family membrane-anchored ribosome-binding protein
MRCGPGCVAYRHVRIAHHRILRKSKEKVFSDLADLILFVLTYSYRLSCRHVLRCVYLHHSYTIVFGSVIMLETNLKTVRTDMKTLIKDAQDLFREATSVTGVKAEELRARGLTLLDTAMAKAQDVQAVAMEKGKEVADSADVYVRENPWRAVAISAGVGVLVGMLIARK